MRKLALGLFGAAALAVSSVADASVIITFGGASPVPGNNDFQGNLAGLGLTQLTTSGATLTLDEASLLTFELLGSESGYNDSFTAGTVSVTEFTGLLDLFASPLLLGSDTFGAGSLAGLLNFSSSQGVNATVGDDGFGIFLGANDYSGLLTNVFYIGYDDQITGQDDNHDDLILRVTVSPAIPEPATWAMMLLGFGAVGVAMRRRRAPVLAQAA